MIAANKGNAVVVLSVHEIGVFLEISAYRKLAKDPTKMIVLMMFLLAGDVCRLHPECSRHQWHYRLLKVHKEGVTVDPCWEECCRLYLTVVIASG
jgi:hypothetical protein